MSEEVNKPGLEEKYGMAVTTSDLRMVSNRAGSADLLASVGISAGLGALLLRLRTEFDQVARDVRRTGDSNLTDALLIFMHLKTLSEAKEALGRYAVIMATKRRHMLTDKQVYALTGNTLYAWLDHKCPDCGGVGRIGGYNGRRPKSCGSCEGTGNRKIELGQNDAQRLFCADLMHAMNQKSGSGVARDVRVNRKAIRQGKEKIQEGIASAS